MYKPVIWTPARAVLLALAVSLAAGCAAKPTPVPPPSPPWDIKLSRDGAGKDLFEVYGLDLVRLKQFEADKPSADQWHTWFAVKVDGNDAPPLLGEYVVADQQLCFRPRFALVPGLRYQATIGNAYVQAAPSPRPQKVFELPKPPPSPPVQVAIIYPTADTLPENLLKFYVHFTGPMRRGEVYDHVRVLDAAGKEIERAFLEIGEELWDRSGRRLTLLFDPGRIKHGLKPREDLGPVLEPGKSYTLVIDGRWRDAEGQPLGRDHKKAFRTSAAVELPVEPADWKITPPPAGSREPLVVTFPRPLDHALLQRVLHVMDAADKDMDGTIAVSEHETRWQFTPRQPWVAGSYNLEVEQILEDLAGNSVGRPFEVDEERPSAVVQQRTRRPFMVVVKP